jgi:hypothetical protein
MDVRQAHLQLTDIYSGAHLGFFLLTPQGDLILNPPLDGKNTDRCE